MCCDVWLPPFLQATDGNLPSDKVPMRFGGRMRWEPRRRPGKFAVLAEDSIGEVIVQSVLLYSKIRYINVSKLSTSGSS